MSPETTRAPIRAGTFAWPRRAMTPAERERLVRAGRLGPRKILWAIAPLAGAGLLGLGLAVLSHHGLELFTAAEDAHLASRIGALAIVVLGGVISVVMFLAYRQVSRPYRLDAREGTVEVIDAAVARAVALGTEASPAFLADVGHGQLLFVCGSWLLDPTIFGGGAPSFPTRRFTLSRAPLSGAVVAVEPRGEPLPPERYDLPTTAFGSVMVTSRDSELIDASLDEVLRLSGAEPRASAP